MPGQQIILANSSRLFRDMLKRIINGSSSLELLKEITDPTDIPAAIENAAPGWVIVSLRFDNTFPAWVDHYITDHPAVCIMAIASDGSKIKVKWLEHHEQELNELSLQDLLRILENHGAPA